MLARRFFAPGEIMPQGGTLLHGQLAHFQTAGAIQALPGLETTRLIDDGVRRTTLCEPYGLASARHSMGRFCVDVGQAFRVPLVRVQSISNEARWVNGYPMPSVW